MKRKLFNLAAMLSMLLCMATVALWAANFDCDLWTGRATTVGELHSFGSTWEYVHTVSTSAAPVKSSLWGCFYSIAPIDVKGFGSRGWSSRPVGMECRIGSPYWIPTLLTSILPVTWVVSLVRRKRIGRCPTCSYDLTGNTSGVCPECGTKINPKAGACA